MYPAVAADTLWNVLSALTFWRAVAEMPLAFAAVTPRASDIRLIAIMARPSALLQWASSPPLGSASLQASTRNGNNAVSSSAKVRFHFAPLPLPLSVASAMA